MSQLVTTVEHAQVDEGEYFTSKTEFRTAEEKTENLEERTIREEEVRRRLEIAPPDRDDDGFVLLDAIPRETPSGLPGIAKIPGAAFKNNFCSLGLYFFALLPCIEYVCYFFNRVFTATL